MKLKESLNFIKECNIYTLVGIIIFFGFGILGFMFPMFQEQIMQVILELKLLFEGLNLWQTMGLIFFNNARASLFAIIFGIFFGIIPLLMAMSNGYIVGFISRMVSNEYSITELWRLLPHGIFELPAVFISIGIGLKMGIEILTKPTKKNFFDNLNKALKTFILIIIPLLIIAAIIEGLLIFYFS